MHTEEHLPREVLRGRLLVCAHSRTVNLADRPQVTGTSPAKGRHLSRIAVACPGIISCYGAGSDLVQLSSRVCGGLYVCWQASDLIP